MSRALDTNIVVRVLADRNSPQFPVALQAMAQSFTLPLTVMLESEWVLRSYYRWRRDQIVDGLRSLLDLPALASRPPSIDWVIDQYAGGADFADMMHLVTAGGVSAFATFDAGVARYAGAQPPIPIETLG